MADIDAVLIAGPTASGKSSLAMSIAHASRGVIVNADSMQVYDGLRLLTARPSVADEKQVPHKLYGFQPADEAYSVGRWGEDVRCVLDECRVEDRLPVIVGGTGLYFSALLEGLSPVPDIPIEIRNKWRSLRGEISGPELHAMLVERDPDMAAQLRPSDPQRVLRALEVFEATGRSLLYWQSFPGEGVLKFDQVRAFVVAPDRDVLYQRCDQRFDWMMENGALTEVRDLLGLGLPPDVPLMGALGVRPLRDYLLESISLEEAVELSKRDTRRYAKRQMTWLRRNMLAWDWLSAQDLERLKCGSLSFR